MNILLIGGAGNLINNLIIKLNKEGHRISLLTGDRYGKASYQNIFEKYNFPYESDSLKEIFESVRPELTVFMGAYDTNFKWTGDGVEREAVRFSASLMNILMAYSQYTDGRFLYLSTQDVYGGSYPENISETEPVTPEGIPAMVWSQGEEMCENYRKSCGKDIIVLRLDHVYGIPESRRDARDICSRMCLEALESKRITVGENHVFSLLYVTDAVEFIHRLAMCREHRSSVYNLSSMRELTETALADMICQVWEEPLELIPVQGQESRAILSDVLYESEFGNPFFCEVQDTVKKITAQMKRKSHLFLNGGEEDKPLGDRIRDKAGWLFKTLLPFAENVILFIPFFMLNNRAVGSEYFANLDFYLLYVLLFAIVYGQHQATLSAVLSVAGYCFRQMYTRSAFEVMLDANTYVWIAQLFILGLVVGYMRDQITKLKQESKSEREFLDMQLVDIQDINSSNVRVKAALETQIVNQNDSVGKIYSITSALDQYSPEEVLFYAAEMLGKLLKSKDVAIYTVSNRAYARLFSSTSQKARQLGSSIQYTNMGELYETLVERKVFINRKMEEHYPLMANAIFENEEMQMIIMVWGIPWERMTLGQANQLVVISALIQNAVLRANRYLVALEEQRYVAGTQTLKTEAFQTLVKAYLTARNRGLTECTLLAVQVEEKDYMEAAKLLTGKLRQSDYIGTLEDGRLYTLLANTNGGDAEFVIRRFAELGYESSIVANG
ncbi:MAG: NAD(P)-dependent oxidoreductase [Butyrivibrio sp.]|nr:NAD(P)-dependent oxidoreductase [Acetatifactor muris]MCM1559250.1 NAD(P)-dependent oxidoreductase [Butyrivibrio sp.]